MQTEKQQSSILTTFRVYVSLEFRMFVIVSLIFVFFSAMGVVAQAFLPDILELSGLEILGLPEPSMISSFIDVWGDFLFIGVILIIFLGSNTFSADLNQEKTIYTYLSRPITRTQHYITKVVLKITIVLFATFLSSFVVYGIGSIFFDTINLRIVLAGSLVLSLALSALLSIIMAANTRLPTMGTVGVGILIWIIFPLIGLLVQAFDWVRWFSPTVLGNEWQVFLIDEDYTDLWLVVLALLGWIIVPALIGWMSFRSRDL